jgi:hypothetical protein
VTRAPPVPTGGALARPSVGPGSGASGQKTLIVIVLPLGAVLPSPPAGFCE